MNTSIDNCCQDVAPELDLLSLDKPLHSHCQLPGTSLLDVVKWAKSIHDQHTSGTADAYADCLSMCLAAVRLKHSFYRSK